jgi:hypothetical protein
MLITATNAGWDIDTYARWLKDTVSGLLLERHRPPASR